MNWLLTFQLWGNQLGMVMRSLIRARFAVAWHTALWARASKNVKKLQNQMCDLNKKCFSFYFTYYNQTFLHDSQLSLHSWMLWPTVWHTIGHNNQKCKKPLGIKGWTFRRSKMLFGVNVTFLIFKMFLLPFSPGHPLESNMCK